MHLQIFFLAFLAAVTLAAPVERMTQASEVPDLEAQNQFLYGYGYGYPGYFYQAALPAAYSAVSLSNVPASTAKLISQPAATAYAYPSYTYGAYPYGNSFGYAYGYPYAI